MTAFNIGEIVVYHSDVCEIAGVLYDCRIGTSRVLIRADATQLRPATPEERATFATQTQKLDKQIAELMAYRKQLEDGTTD